MGRDRYKIIDTSFPHHITCTVKDWYPLFMNPEIVGIIYSSLKFLQKEKLNIYAYVIMENHLHLIAKSEILQTQIQRFKSYTATEILTYLKNYSHSQLLHNFKYVNKLTHSKHKLWEEGFHPKMIENVDIMSEKIKYIHENPVRRGYIDNPADWRYSSARNYEGQPGLLDVIIDW